MGGGGRPAVLVGVQRRFWAEVRAGSLTEEAARAVGVSQGLGRRWFRRVGGVIPSLSEPCGYRLSLAEREEIACLRAAGHGPREIGRRIGRPGSTVCRELARNTTSPRRGYRAGTAQAQGGDAGPPPQAAQAGRPAAAAGAGAGPVGGESL